MALKLPLIETLITAHNFVFLCLSETFLDSTIPHNDANINFSGYSLLRADHPINTKRRGVCMHFKESLPLIRSDDPGNLQ